MTPMIPRNPQPSVLRVRLASPDGEPANASPATLTRLRAAAGAYGLTVTDAGTINGALVLALYHHPRIIAAPESFTSAAQQFARLAEEITGLSAQVDTETYTPNLIYL